MATTTGMQRKLAKQQMKKLSEGNLVSDRETQQYQAQATQAAQSAAQAGMKDIARAQRALAQGGAVQSGAMAKMGQASGQALADTSARANLQANTIAANLAQQRAAQAIAEADKQYARKQQRFENVMKGIETAGAIGSGGASTLGGAAVGAMSNAMRQGEG
jgi:hypothetical protein